MAARSVTSADRNGAVSSSRAGLDLLGSADGDHALTVRGVCKQAGLATR